jgi:hypothetical protein
MNSATVAYTIYGVGKCVMIIGNDSLETMVFLGDTFIILQPSRLDPYFINIDPSEKRTHYECFEFSLNLSAPSCVEVAHVIRNSPTDLADKTSPNPKARVNDPIRVDTLGKCTALLERAGK